jgi:hypothetical protein
MTTRIEILKASFDLLWKEVEFEGLETEFCKYLEEYDFYDLERARDLARDGNL